MSPLYTGLPAGWLILFCVLASSPVRAGEEDFGEMEMEMFFAPAETVTSVVRHAQPLEQSPSAVTVLTREDIQASGARTLTEVLRLVPNMNVAMVKPLWYEVGVRGNSSLASDTMLLLIDGRDVTVDFFGFASWTDQTFSVDEIERIEVIRGPGSALYGANAYSGVVNVITRTPDRAPRAGASVRGGEQGSSEINLAVNPKLGPVHLGVQGGLVRQDFWTQPGETAREVLRGRVLGKVALAQDASLQVEAGGYHLKGLLYTTGGNAQVDHLINLYGRARIEYDEWMIQSFYDSYDVSTLVDMKLNYLGLELARLPQLEGRMGKWTLQVQHHAELAHNRLTCGGEYVLNHYHSDQLVRPDQTEHRIGIYLQDELDLSALIAALGGPEVPPLVLTAGLRFDEHSVTRWELSPRLAVVFTPVAGHGFRLGYAHAFLRPTFFETSFDLKLDSQFGFDVFAMGNPRLDNQTIDSLELGYIGEFFRGHLRLEVDFAVNWYDKLIWTVFDPARMGTIQVGGARIPDLTDLGDYMGNVPGHRGHNLEIQLTVLPTRHTRVFGGVGYRQLFDRTTGAFLDREPVWHMLAGLDLGSPDGWSASLRGYFMGKHNRGIADPQSMLEPETRQQLPATFLLNARFAWLVELAGLRASAGVEAFNLLGARSREFAGFRIPNQPDFGGERLARKIVFFLQGEI